MANVIELIRINPRCDAGEAVGMTVGGYTLSAARDITFTWSVVASPNNSPTDYLFSPANPTGPNATLIPLVPGCYTVRVLCCVRIQVK